MATNTTNTYNDDGDSNSTETETDRVTDEYQRAAVTRRNSAPILARRRRNLDREAHVTDYDYRRDGDRHKIVKTVRPGPDGTETEREDDQEDEGTTDTIAEPALADD